MEFPYPNQPVNDMQQMEFQGYQQPDSKSIGRIVIIQSDLFITSLGA